ncbi:ALP1-like protein, partial [Tanacetum coccineum]
ESARKDVERAFGVLQGRWGLIQQPARAYEVNTLRRIMSLQTVWIDRCQTQRRKAKELRDKDTHISLQQNHKNHIGRDVEEAAEEKAVMEIYGAEFLRKPTVTDIEKLYRHHEEKHGFPGMLGSLDSVASQDLWIWHVFFGVVGSNNDVNVLYQHHLFNDLKTGQAPEIPFVTNSVTYRYGNYLVDEIYPELAKLVKTIPKLADDDHKRILYKQKQESARKDVERAFGVLKKKWDILAANPTQALSPTWFPEEAHHPDDMVLNDEQVQQVMRWIRSSQAHQNLQHDLIEHLSRNV